MFHKIEYTLERSLQKCSPQEVKISANEKYQAQLTFTACWFISPFITTQSCHTRKSKRIMVRNFSHSFDTSGGVRGQVEVPTYSIPRSCYGFRVLLKDMSGEPGWLESWVSRWRQPTQDPNQKKKKKMDIAIEKKKETAIFTRQSPLPACKHSCTQRLQRVHVCLCLNNNHQKQAQHAGTETHGF